MIFVVSLCNVVDDNHGIVIVHSHGQIAETKYQHLTFMFIEGQKDPHTCTSFIL